MFHDTAVIYKIGSLFFRHELKRLCNIKKCEGKAHNILAGTFFSQSENKLLRNLSKSMIEIAAFMSRFVSFYETG